MPPVKTIGFISNWPVYQGTTMDHYAHSLIQGISAAARENNCNLLLGCGFSVTGKSPQVHSFWPVPGPGIDFVPVGPWNTDGLIIVPDELTTKQEHYIRDLLDSGFPLVLTAPEGPGPLVKVDNAFGVHQAFDHLREHGRQRIAFIAGNPGQGGDSAERLNAYLDALSTAGITYDPRLVAYGEHRREGGAAAMQQILDSRADFDAVIASNDLSGLGAIEILRSAGLSIPNDVAVIGFDDILEARAATPALTTVRHPTYSLGYQAVQTLLEYIRGFRSGSTQVVVPTRLIIRQSCGCGSEFDEVRPAVKEPVLLANEIADACYNESRRSRMDDLRHQTDQFLRGFSQSLVTRNPDPFLAAVNRIFNWTSEHREGYHIWRKATAVILRNLPGILERYPDSSPVFAAGLLDRVLLEISDLTQKQTTASMLEYMGMTAQLGRLTAEMLSAMSIDQTAEILTRHLPRLGIENALVAVYDTANEDQTASGTILFGAGIPEKLAGKKFDPRRFPVQGLYSTGNPLQLTILPLRVDESTSGFVAFNAPNPELCAAIVHNLGAALRTSRLYNDALEGRRLAEEASQLKSRFLSMVSHELRTPLSLIVGLSEMSLSGKTIDMRDIEQINTSAQHLARLIGDVLDLASSEAGQLRILQEPLDLVDVIQVTARIGEQLAHEKGLEWEANLPSRGPWIMGDRTRLRQVILNLVSNAVKFTPSGKIQLDVEMNGGEVVVSVSDTGLGIAPAELEKIFNEFYRTERIIEAGVGGIGLGLAITKQLVDKHGGRIDVRSPGKLGQGSTFRFTLPVLSADSPLAEFNGPLMKPGTTVMVFTDGEETGKQIHQYLDSQGFEVQTCIVNEKAEWLAEVKAVRPAALILGEALAAREGWAIAGILKLNPETEAIPVFACRLDAERDQGQMLELNYLHKPLKPDQLKHEMNRLLAESDTPQVVLVVDDDPNILNMHRRMVENSGKMVVTARNGREAMEVVSHNKPDLILLDLMMPEMDGFQVLDALRSSETTRDIPVIILTARLLSDADLDRCNRGVASVLSKGVFSAEETLKHIESALSRQSTLNSATRQLIRRAVTIIHARFAEPLTREEIANQLNISADYLTDCFRQEFGITPITYIRRYRIKQACDLLLSTDRSITQISVDVGFADSAHFTRTFIREMGKSPKAFRHQGKK